MKSERPEREPTDWRDTLTVVGVVVLLLAVIGPIGYLTWFAVSGSRGPSAEAPAPTGQLSEALGTTVQRLCQEQVRSQLKAPSTARFGDDRAPSWDGKQWTLTGTVDAENSFGAALRSTWSCQVRGESIDAAQAQATLF